MPRPLANELPPAPAGIKQADPADQSRWKTARALSARYAALLLKLADAATDTPDNAIAPLTALRSVMDDLSKPLGPYLRQLCYHWPELAEHAQAFCLDRAPTGCDAFPLGCIVRRKDSDATSARFRVLGYTVEFSRLALTLERCDGQPCFWQSGRVPVQRESVMAGLCEVVHG